MKKIIRDRAKTYGQLCKEYDALRKSETGYLEDVCGEAREKHVDRISISETDYDIESKIE